MKEINLQNKVINAAKWSTVTEVASRLVSPITYIILARILAPEAFGVIATITMIISLVDMFADSGFQKYLVQCDFKSSKEKFQFANVAFWTNFSLSILFWLLIIVFSEQIATLIGSPGLGFVISIACIQIPLSAFSSVQEALFRRDFDFKKLFWVRGLSICIPFIITIPLALSGLGYWALVIGAISIKIVNVIMLTIISSWKPRLFYSFKILKDMYSFSMWSMIEAISIWLTTWIDAFIIGFVLNEYFLGIYKTSTTMVNTLMAVITASIVPVLFSALSRLQKDESQFNNMFLKAQKYVSILVLPLGVGVYLYSDLATGILLGSNWAQASEVIGVWALTSSIVIIFSHFSSEAYRAKGRPKLSFIAQVLHLIVLVPACLISSKFGFWPFVYIRSWIRMQGILVNLILMKFYIGFPIFKIFKNIYLPVISVTLMGGLGYFLQQIYTGLIWDIFSILVCAIFYLVMLLSFPNTRKDIFWFFKKISNKICF